MSNRHGMSHRGMVSEAPLSVTHNAMHTRGFCWTCGKTKKKLGGKVRTIGGRTRFTCIDCLNNRKAATA